MRSSILGTTSLLALLAAAPAQAQLAARLHSNIVIGRSAPVVAVPARRPIVVRDYVAERYGPWQQYARYWTPATLYLNGGQYYAYPITAARPVIAYRYRNEVFPRPRDRQWVGLHEDVRARPRP